MLKIKNEAYLDDEEQFWDYNTGEVSGNDLFDTSKTGMSYYDDFLKDLKYMQDEKNLTADIVMMSPMEYFEGCAEIFNSDVNKQIEYTKADKKTIEHLKEVINKYHKKFPITFLNYAERTQEGRHRMLTAAELTSWDTKFPVMVIKYFDEDRQKEIDDEKKRAELSNTLYFACKNAKMYNYANYDEFKQQVVYELEKKLGDGAVSENDVTVQEKGNMIVVSYSGVSEEIYKDEINLKEPDTDDDFDIKWDDIDLDDFDLDDFDDIDTYLSKLKDDVKEDYAVKEGMDMLKIVNESEREDGEVEPLKKITNEMISEAKDLFKSRISNDVDWSSFIDDDGNIISYEGWGHFNLVSDIYDKMKSIPVESKFNSESDPYQYDVYSLNVSMLEDALIRSGWIQFSMDGGGFFAVKNPNNKQYYAIEDCLEFAERNGMTDFSYFCGKTINFNLKSESPSDAVKKIRRFHSLGGNLTESSSVYNAVSKCFGQRARLDTNNRGQQKKLKSILQKYGINSDEYVGKYVLHHGDGNHNEDDINNLYLFPTKLHNGITGSASSQFVSILKDCDEFKNLSDKDIISCLDYYVYLSRGIMDKPDCYTDDMTNRLNELQSKYAEVVAGVTVSRYNDKNNGVIKLSDLIETHELQLPLKLGEKYKSDRDVTDRVSKSQLKDRAKKHKKHSKGLGWYKGANFNSNAGDVEKGIEVFNNSADVGAVGSADGGMGESLSRLEALHILNKEEM